MPMYQTSSNLTYGDDHSSIVMIGRQGLNKSNRCFQGWVKVLYTCCDTGSSAYFSSHAQCLGSNLLGIFIIFRSSSVSTVAPTPPRVRFGNVACLLCDALKARIGRLWLSRTRSIISKAPCLVAYLHASFILGSGYRFGRTDLPRDKSLPHAHTSIAHSSSIKCDALLAVFIRSSRSRLVVVELRSQRRTTSWIPPSPLPV